MASKLGDRVPDFTAQSTQGTIYFHDFINGSWAILFSHPNDFTPVCTTELASVAALMPEFLRRGVKVLALSCNGLSSHLAWIRDIESVSPGRALVTYPIICDESRDIATMYGMLDPAEKDSQGMPLTARTVFIVGPDKLLKASILYPATTGRNFGEILRVIDSLQLTAAAQGTVATPVEWKPGESCMIAATVSDEEAVALFPRGFETVSVPSGRRYMRVTPHPEVAMDWNA